MAFCLWFVLLKGVLKSGFEKHSQTNENKLEIAVFLGQSGGMRSRRGETREGSEIQKMQDLGKSYWKEFFKSSFVNSWVANSARSSLPYGQGGGALRAIRRARSRWPVKLAKYYPRLKART